MRRKKDFWGGFKGEKPHKNAENFLSGSAQDRSEKRGEKYEVVVSRESIIIIIISISFITRKQNASLHKQQATTRGLTSYL